MKTKEKEQEIIEKIKLILRDFKPSYQSNEDFLKFVNIITGIYHPPAYMVELLLLGILGFKNYGRLDKIWWHTYLEYKNHKFMIRDYKFGTWSIESTEYNEETVKLAEEIRNKIIAASKLLDKLLYDSLNEKIEKNDFYLNNVYGRLSYIYEFYKEKIQSVIKQYHKLEEESKNKKTNLNDTIEF